MTLLPLDGPASQYSISVADNSVSEVKDGTVLAERKVVTLQPLDGGIYVYFGDGTNTPSVSDIQNDGFEQPKKALRSYEASSSQPIFILSQSGTVDVKVVERG